jgi:uncharacterized membrane protein YoaK (UPF0700 family)
MSSDLRPLDKWLSFGLAFVGGFGDAAGFLLAKTFTGHVTGNLVLGAIALASHTWRDLFGHLLAIVFFLAGIPLAVLIAALKPPSWASLPITMATEVILITAAYLALAFHFAPDLKIFVICMALALGLQNAAFRRTGGISVHTNYLTGMITGLLAGAIESHVVPAHVPTDPKTRLLSGIWGAFFLGAAIGAAMVLRFEERGILALVPILLWLIARDLILPQPTDSAR